MCRPLECLSLGEVGSESLVLLHWWVAVGVKAPVSRCHDGFFLLNLLESDGLDLTLQMFELVVRSFCCVQKNTQMSMQREVKWRLHLH